MKVSFGSRLKERREQLNITQVQLAEMLGVTKGAVGNYETDLNSPKATILYKVFEVLKCDANYLFQDEMNELSKGKDAFYEYEPLINKYDYLDDFGKRAVNAILDIEYERCRDEEENTVTLDMDDVKKLNFEDVFGGKLLVARKSKKKD